MGARCLRGQGALTSPACLSRGSRLHVPRASPARLTSLRRARTRALDSRVRFVPAHARPNLTDRFEALWRPIGVDACTYPRPLGAPPGPPLSPTTWSRPPALGSSGVQVPCAAAFSTFSAVEVASSPRASSPRLTAPRFLRSSRKPRTVLGVQSAQPSLPVGRFPW